MRVSCQVGRLAGERRSSAKYIETSEHVFEHSPIPY